MLKRLTAGLLTLCMLLTLVPISVVAEETAAETAEGLLYPNRIFAYDNANAPGFPDCLNAEIKCNRRAIYVFNDIEVASLLSSATFRVGQRGTIEYTNKHLRWAVLDHSVNTSEEVAAILNTASGTWGNEFLSVGTNGIVKKGQINGDKTTQEETETESGGGTRRKYDLPLADMEITTGQTLVILLPVMNANGYLCGMNTTTRTKPQINYTLTKSVAEFEAEVLEEVLAAVNDTAALKKVLETYKNTIGIDVSGLDSKTVAEVQTALQASVPASLADVKTAYDTIVFVAYSMPASKVFSVSGGVGTDLTGGSSTTRNKRLLYVFNNIENASKMKDIFFSVGKYGTTQDKPWYWAIVENPITTVTEALAVANGHSNTFLGVGQGGTIKIGTIAYADIAGVADPVKNDSSNMWKAPLSVTGMANGQSLVILVPQTTANDGIGVGKSDRQEPMLSYKYAKSFFEAEVLAEVIAAVNDTAALKEVLEAYKNTIGIDVSSLDYALTDIQAALQATELNELADVTTAYNSVMAARITEKSVVADFAVQKNDDGTYTDNTGNTDWVNRYNKNKYYVFNKIENAEAINGLKFRIGSGSTSSTKKEERALYYSIQKNAIDTVAKLEAIVSDVAKRSISGTGAWITENGGNYYQYNLSNIAIEPGDTLVVAFIGGGSDTMPFPGTTNQAAKPQLLYSWDEGTFKAEVLKKINTAENEAALKAVLETYSNTINIDIDNINDAVIADIYPKLAGQNIATLEEVKTIVDASIAGVIGGIVDEIKGKQVGDDVSEILISNSTIIGIDAAVITPEVAEILKTTLAGNQEIGGITDIKTIIDAAVAEADKNAKEKALFDAIKEANADTIGTVVTENAETIGIDPTIVTADVAVILGTTLAGQEHTQISEVKTIIEAAVQTAKENAVLAAIDNATADTIETVIKDNKEIIGIDEGILTPAVVEKIQKELEAVKALASVQEVKAYIEQAKSDTTEILYADFAAGLNNGTWSNKTESTWEGERRYGNTYFYVFNEIEFASKLSGAEFRVGTTSAKDANIAYKIIDERITEAAQLNEYNTGFTTGTASTGTDETFTGTQKMYFKCDFSNVEIKDGQTLIVRFSGGDSFNTIGLPAFTNFIKPQLLYGRVDMDAHRADVLMRFVYCTAEDCEGLLRAYNNMIGIDISYLNDSTKAAVIDSVVGNQGDFMVINEDGTALDLDASFAKIKEAYDSVFADSAILNELNSITADIADAEFIEKLTGYSERLELNAYYIDEYTVADLKAALIGQDFKGVDEVKAAYESTYSEAAVLAKINAVDEAGLEKLFTFYADVIGIDSDKIDTATLPYLQPALIGKSFADMASVKTAFNKAVDDNFINSLNADFSAARYKDNTTWADSSSWSTQSRWEYNIQVYVFNEIEYGTLMNGLRFRVGSNSGSNEIKTLTYKVFDSAITTAEQGKTIDWSGAKTAGGSWKTDAETTNKGYYEYNLGSLAIEPGQTLAVKLEGGNDTRIAYPAATAYLKPQLMFNRIERVEYNRTVLAAVNASADDAEAIEKLLKEYKTTLGIDTKYITTDTIGDIAAAINAGKPFADINKVTEAYNKAIASIFDETSIMANAVFQSGVDNTGWTDVTGNGSARRVGLYTYYVFNEVEYAADMMDLKFRVGYDPGAGLQPKDIWYYVTDDTIETAEEMEAVYADVKTQISAAFCDSTGKDVNINGHQGYFEYSLANVNISDGQTLIIKMDQANHSYIGTPYSSYMVRPVLVSGVDMDGVKAKVLNKINSAIATEDKTALETVIRDYNGVIKVHTSYLDNESNKETIFDILTLNQYTTLEEFKNTYKGTIAGAYIMPLKNVDISVDSEEQQTFKGFGFTVTPAYDFTRYNNENAENMFTAGFDGLYTKSIKLWTEIGLYVGDDGTIDADEFISVHKDAYDEAKAHGVPEIILGPTVNVANLPAYLREGSNGKMLAADKAADYGKMLADFIKALNDKGMKINATSIINESQAGIIREVDGGDVSTIFADIVVALRAKLNEYGLSDVKIVGPEFSNDDDGFRTFIAKLKEKTEAWNALDAIAVHSYNMSIRSDFVSEIGDKTIISTESSVTDGEFNSVSHAASSAARALNDINNGSSLWMHFFAFGSGKTNGTSLLDYEYGQGVYTEKSAYKYIQLLADTFREGTRINHVKLNGNEMNYTYNVSGKPVMQAAAGVDKNGKRVIALLNATDDYRAELKAGFQTVSDTMITVNLSVPALADVEEVTFDVYQTDTADEGKVTIGNLTLRNGAAKVDIYPRQMIVLKEQNTDNAEVVHCNTEDGKVYLRVAGDKNASGMTGYLGLYEGEKLIEAKTAPIGGVTNVTPFSATIGNADKVRMFVFDSEGKLVPQMGRFEKTFNN